jgi:putative two-component system response regulator
VYKGELVASAAQELLKELLESNLIRNDDWEALNPGQRQRFAGMTDPNRLLDQLLVQHLLTGYQAGRIRARKPQWLILGNYRILDRLGAGSLGVVFKADHLVTRDLVAIKVLVPTGKSTRSPLLKLLAERHSVAQVQHANIVRALDVGEARSDDPDCPVVYFYVMEHVSGIDLEHRVNQDGPLAVPEACDIAYQIAAALSAAHQCRLVHRDLKPSNVLITESGQAKLVDFGLVRSFNAALGNSAVLPSRPEFMAPELFESKETVDIRADLYGLGATLFWALAGVPPFQPKTDGAALDGGLIGRQVPQLKEHGVEAPAELQDLLNRLLSARAADRPEDPIQVMYALASFRPEGSAEACAQPEFVETEKPGGTVLLVDTDAAARQTWRQALIAEGLLCDDAENIKSALPLALAGSHDVIVVATEMPEVSGQELIQYLRQHLSKTNLKILALCPATGGGGHQELVGAGADECLTKPIEAEAFVRMVKNALSLKRDQDLAAAQEPKAIATPAEPLRPPRSRPLLTRPIAWLWGAKRLA